MEGSQTVVASRGCRKKQSYGTAKQTSRIAVYDSTFERIECQNYSKQRTQEEYNIFSHGTGADGSTRSVCYRAPSSRGQVEQLRRIRKSAVLQIRAEPCCIVCSVLLLGNLEVAFGKLLATLQVVFSTCANLQADFHDVQQVQAFKIENICPQNETGCGKKHP